MIDVLRKFIVLDDPKNLAFYSKDNSRHSQIPKAVLLPKNNQEVQAIIKICYDENIPLTVRGGGTGTPGGAVPVRNGIVLSMEKINNIIKIDANNRYMTVEAGVIHQDVQNAAYQKGFFWAPDPGSSTTSMVGGNLGYNAAGPRAIKYGSTREHVLGLTAVTGTGEIIHTGGYTTKNSVGYDLTRLLIGSEGTLAVITEAILKLTPLPVSQKTYRVLYKDIHAAAEAVITIMSQPYVPSALEFLDEESNTLMGFTDVGAMLLINIDDEAAVEKIQTACQNSGLLKIEFAESHEERQRLWAARKLLSLQLKTLSPYKINEDVVVPISEIPALLAGLKKLSEKYHVPIVNFGHAGNGNIHVNILAERADACLSEVFDLVIKLNGTLSGEHGIGLEKKPFISRVIDKPTLDIMKNIKKIFDPKNILNPGKIFP